MTAQLNFSVYATDIETGHYLHFRFPSMKRALKFVRSSSVVLRGRAWQIRDISRGVSLAYNDIFKKYNEKLNDELMAIYELVNQAPAQAPAPAPSLEMQAVEEILAEESQAPAQAPAPAPVPFVSLEALAVEEILAEESQAPAPIGAGGAEESPDDDDDDESPDDILDEMNRNYYLDVMGRFGGRYA